jgi:cellulose synthase operon protein B
LQYLAPHIRHESLRIVDSLALDPAHWPDSDIVLLGTRDQLAPYLSEAEQRAITAAYLSVRPVDPASSTMLFVVSGTTPREVARAAQALGRLDLPRADTSSALISGPDLPVLQRRVERTLVAPGSERTLADLGYRTRTVRGYNRERIDVRFDLPADFYVAERENVELALDFAYGANLRPDSVLNVLLNGNFQQAIPLANAQGAALRDYRLRLPMRSFERGPNVITFEPVMVPTITGECVAVEDRNLALTLYDRSILRVPAASHYAEIPDLALFAMTGFPYAQPSAWLQGSETAAPVTMVTVADNDSASLAAAWTFLAKLAQSAGVSLPDLALGTRVAPGTEHQLWIGAWDALDPVLRAAAPFTGGTTPATRVHAAVPAPAPEMGALTRWLGTWIRPDVPEPRAAALRLQLNASEMLQDQGVLMAFQSPHAAGRAQTIVSAATPELLRARVEALVQSEIWNQLDGDIVLWSDVGRNVHRERVAAGFMLGDPGYRDVFRYHVAQRPWLLIVAVFGLLLIAALLVHQLLNRRTRRHHDDSVTPAL